MLADWYFCNCIKAPPRSASTFLIILDAMDNPLRDPDLLAHALRQLCRTNTWMRIYALPRVLSLLVSPEASDYRKLISEHLEDLASLLSPEIESSILQLVRALLADRLPSSSDVVRIGHQLNSLPARQAASRPYLDLREFLPETFFLAIVAHLLERNVARYAAAVSNESGESARLQACLVSAREGVFGRLPFLLSLQIFGFLASAKDLAAAVLAHSVCAHLEPDLLRRFAQLSFHGASSSSRAAAMLEESLTMSMLRRSFEGREFEANPALPYMNERELNVLSTVFWQCTLWNLAVELDPENAATQLGSLWQVPQDRTAHVRVEMPDRFSGVIDRERLNQLAASRYKGIRGKGEKPRVQGFELRFVPNCSFGQDVWIFYSPWLSLEKRAPRKVNPRFLRYPDAQKLGPFLRLLVCAVLSSKLLRTVKEQRQFAALLVHAADVLSTYRFWLLNCDRLDQAEVMLPQSWTALALFAQGEISEIARCGDPSINPEVFTELLTADIAATPSQDAQSFQESVVPWVLVDWIMDSYVAACGPSGAGRWFRSIPSVFDAVKQMKGSIRQMITAAVLVRLFRKDTAFEFSDAFNLDWRTATKRKDPSSTPIPLQWRVDHRQLFLTPDLAAQDWLRPGWQDPDEVDDDENKAEPHQKTEISPQKLVRAIERRAALKKPEGLDPEVKERWRSEWKSMLSAISRLESLDRLVRVRLLELLEDKLAILSEDEQSLIALVILEYGSHYDIHRLFAEIFPVDETGRLVPPCDAVRHDVRRKLLYAMFQYTSRGVSSEMEDPRAAQREAKRIRIVEEMLRAVAVHGEPEVSHDELRRQLTAHIQEFWEKRSAELPIVEATVIETGRQKRLVFESVQEPRDWMVRSCLNDPNDGVLRLTIDQIDLKGMEDVFAQELDQFQALHGSETVIVIATVVSVNKNNGGYECIFNCALPIYLPTTLEHCGFKEGDLVSLPIQRIIRDGRTFWMISRRRTIEKLENQQWPGCFELIHISCVTRGNRTLLEFRVAKNSSVFWHAKDVLDIWDTDLSRAYRGPDTSRVVVARLQQGGSWLPVDGDFCAFLALEMSSAKPFAVLTFIDAVDDRAPEASWRFAVRPGVNYVLDERVFTTEAAARLEQELNSIENPTGLIITVEVIIVGKVVCLGLVQASDSRIEGKDYPRLRTPFDRRNIEWRHLFANKETVEVSRDGENWSVKLDTDPVPGFPATITVHNENLRGQAPLQVTVDHWDPREARLQIETVRLEELAVPLDKRLAFANSWLNLKANDQLSIIGRVGEVMEDGYIRCRARERTHVLVEAESITMALLRGALERNIPRTVQITATPRWATAVEMKADPDEIPSGIRNCGEAFGILARVPANLGTQTALCEVWWLIGDRVEAHNLHIPQSILGRDAIGARVTVVKVGDERRIFLQTRRIRTRALWQLVQSENAGEGVLFLGNVEHGGEMRSLAQTAAGSLLILPEVVRARHLAERIGPGSWSGGLDPNALLKNSAPQWLTWFEGNTPMRRARFVTPSGILAGNCNADSPDSHGTATVKLRLRTVGNGLFALRRSFEISPIRSSPRQGSSAEMESRKWQEELNRYFESPTDLPIEIEQSGDSLRLFTLKSPRSDGTGWTNIVPVADGEGAYLTGSKYSRNGKARLLRMSDGQFVASFRQVPPLTVSGYKSEIAADNDGEPVPVALYYVGAEKALDGSVLHRFEWGYGSCLLAYERELRFDDKPFETANAILFHSDRIKQVRFTRDEEGPADHWIMWIQRIDIEFSDSTTLYHQRSQFSIVHVLDLVIRNGEFQVNSVVGFSSEFIGSSEKLASVKTFERVRAELGPDSQSYLRQRFDGSPRDGETSIRVLGRLDEEAFRRSSGQSLVFHHVQMSFKSESSGTLRDKELVLMEAGEIRRLRNDTALVLRSYPGLLEDDIGSDFENGCPLFRRDFSAREDLLRVIWEREGAGARARTIYLVHLEYRYPKVHTQLVFARTPARRPDALISEIARTKRPVLATVVGTRDESLRIELKPGAYFILTRDRVETWLPDLETGTLIRVEMASSEAPNPRFRITPAAFGDSHYVPLSTRPCVALPKNPLLDRDLKDPGNMNPSFWAGAENFSISGLAAIEPSCGSYAPDLQEWSKPDPRQFVALMRTPHPKVARLGIDEEGRFKISPYDDQWPVGTLHLNGLVAEFEPCGYGPERHCLKLEWCALTFADKPIREVIERCAHRGWKPHDDKTGYWTEEGLKEQPLGIERLFVVDKSPHDEISGGGSKEKTVLSQSSGRSWSSKQQQVTGGVVFLAKVGRYFGLRYAPSDFEQFGFPVDELLESLTYEPDSAGWYTVAGVSTNGGLWIEICPGRLSELPGQLVVLATSQTERPLSNMNWFAFSPGDEVRLRLCSDRLLTVDRVALLEWVPGARGSLGNKALLPVCSTNRDEGSVVLGGGQYLVNLPYSEPYPEFSLGVVKSNNELSDASGRLPRKNDVVLLGLTPSGAPCILGFPDWVPLPKREQGEDEKIWRDDLMTNLIMSRLGDLIAACGGALPVTADFVLRDRRVMYFSRSQQSRAPFPPGCISLGRIVGLIHNSATVILRCGATLFAAQLESIVFGLPLEYSEAATRTLKERDVWVRRDQDDLSLQFGLKKEAFGEFPVEPLAAIEGSTKSVAKGGIICRSTDSSVLYWLPAREAAWTSLTHEDIKALATNEWTAEPFVVSIGVPEKWFAGVSAVEVGAARREFSGLRVGKELDVRVVAKRANVAFPRYLVRSLSSGVIFECETFTEEPLKLGETIAVEVTRKNSGVPKNVVVVPLGQKRYTLHLPPMMFSDSVKSGNLSSKFQLFLQWRGERGSVLSKDASAMTDQELDRANCFLWNSIKEWSHGDVRRIANVASVWKQRNIHKPELKPEFALMVILILYECGERHRTIPESRAWRRSTVELCRNLASRALCGVHVEVLRSRLLYHGSLVTAHPDFLARLERIREILAPTLGSRDVKLLDQFCRAVELRPSSSVAPVAKALSALLGKSHSIEELISAAPVSRGLTTVFRTLPDSKSGFPAYLHRSHAHALERILAYIEAQKIDLAFAEPVPPFLSSEQEQFI